MSGVQRARPEFQFSVKRLLAVFVAVSILLGGWQLLVRSAIPEHKAFQIEEGMTHEEVRALLGKPHGVENDLWLYRVWDAGEMFKIEFDGEGNVEWASF